MTHTSLRAHSENMANFVVSIYDNQIDRYDGVFDLNEHGDLYFLLHNFGVQIIPFEYICIFNLSEGKKDNELKPYTEAFTQGCKL